MGVRAPSAPGAARIAGVYAATAAAWIVFSDQLVRLLLGGRPESTSVQTAKGLLYVLATTVLLFTLIRRLLTKVQRTEAELRGIFESMSDALVVADARGGVVDANEAAMHMLGLRGRRSEVATLADLRKQLRGADGRIVRPDDDVLLQALRGKVTTGWQAVLTGSGGEERSVSVSAAPVRAEGEIQLAVAVLRDVTDLRRLERLRDEFLSTAAHELKTPVAAIKGYVQLLRRWAPDGHEPREKAAFEVLNRQCERITRLIQELLEVSRLQLGKLQLRRERFDLCDLASDVLVRMQAVASAHGLRLLASEPVPIEADRDRLEQVLVNLLDNAIRFSPGGGEIVVTVRARDGRAEVAVSDRGVGIPSERRAHLFEPFYLAHAETTFRYQGGLGIGLHICREIVERHGGRIWFESQEGEGSTFHFSLSLAAGSADEQRPQDGAGSR